MKAPALVSRSLAARLALVYGLVSVATVLALGAAAYLLTARHSVGQVNDELSSLADFYAVYTAAVSPDEARLRALAPSVVGFFAPQADHNVRLFNARSGALLASTHDIGTQPSTEALGEIRRHQPSLFLSPSDDQASRLFAARTVVTADGTALAVVELSRDVSDILRFLSVLRLTLVGAGALALFGSVTVSFLLARRLTRPLREMGMVARSVAAGDFTRRLPTVSHDEIGRLGDSINQMAIDLSRLEAARREFITKISHDLRTPLTAIKGFVVNLQDVAPEDMRSALETMDGQTDRLIRLVDDLLLLSRLDRGDLRMRRAETDLVAIARSAATICAEKAKRLGVELTLDLPQPQLQLLGDTDRLQQVVINLLDNALRATPVGGRVWVRAWAQGDEIILTVCDNGRGLTAEQESHAFEPYYHGPGGGAGLGLTIAREIVMAHDGRIWLQARPEGGAEAGFAIPCSSGDLSER